MAPEIIQGLNSYFTFRLGSKLFAVNVGQITKILELTEITKVPNSPKYFKGIINLFGDIIPVFDGRLKFRLSETEVTKKTCILILVFEIDSQAVKSGIIVDSVEKVLLFKPEQIQPASSVSGEFNTEFINGVLTYNDELVIILNIEKIFSKEEISIVSAVE